MVDCVLFPAPLPGRVMILVTTFRGLRGHPRLPNPQKSLKPAANRRTVEL